MRFLSLLSLSLAFLIPCFCFAESNLTPTQPLETNPLAQKFMFRTKNSNTHVYVTQFTGPGTAYVNNPDSSSLDSLNSWVNNPGQVLSNDVLNRYGVGMQVGF